MSRPRTSVRLRRSAARLAAVALLAVSGAAGLGAAPAAAGPGSEGDGGPGASTATVTTTDGAGRRVTLSHPTTIAPGADIVVSGTGWQVGDASAGSLLTVLLDARYSGDPATVHTRRRVVNPVTGAVTTDTRIHALVRAAADGTWTARIPYPTAANARLADGTWTDWTPGSEHEVRVLTGSLLRGDVTRSVAATVTVEGGDGDGAGDGIDDGTPPSWAHETLEAGAARAWVERSVRSGDGATLRLRGAGWTTRAGAGSTVAVKLVRDPGGAQHTRSGADVVRHPSAAGDITIWALLTPQPGDHPRQHPIGPDGSFDVALDLPDVAAGDHLAVTLQSGRFADGDVQRTVTSAPLLVDGVAWTGDPGGPGETVACRPTSARPTVRVETPVAALGGDLVVSGAGWCHPSGGGSRIGVKIDEGAVARTDDTVHTNRTIWAVVQADARTGTFRTRLRLPDGTPATSTPALGRGAHTLRLLSGTLRPGDTLRSVLSEPFSIGRYRPAGTPDPLEAGEDLRPGVRGGVAAALDGTQLRLRVPRGRVGEWVFVTAYVPDGSPRYPWSRWQRLDADRALRLEHADRLPAGRIRLAVQSGEQTRLGRLLGWAPLLVADPAAGGPGSADGTGDGPAAGAAPGPVVAEPPPRVEPVSAAPAGPRVVPAALAPDAAALRRLPRGGARAEVAGRLVLVRVPAAAPGDVVHVRLYPVGARPRVVDGGWAVVDADGAVRVRVHGLDGTEVLLALQASDASLLGWAPATPGGAPYVVQAAGDPALGADPGADLVPVADPGAGDPEAGRSWFAAADAGLLALGAVGLAGAAGRARRRAVAS